MFKQIIHTLFHPAQNKHIHKYVPDTMVVEYDIWGGFITANFVTVCPSCGYQSTRKVAFLWDSDEVIAQSEQISKYTSTEYNQFRKTLAQAKQNCMNYTGD